MKSHTLLKSVALAMGVAVPALSILRAATPELNNILLGIGLLCLALAGLQQE